MIPRLSASYLWRLNSVMVRLYKVAPAALLVQIVLQFRRGVHKQGTHRRLFR
jgi:hypothetical protein